MKEIVADPNLVARCGLYCGACDIYLAGNCPGCRGDHAKNACGVRTLCNSNCKIRTCCESKGHRTCASCQDHPVPKNCGKFNNFSAKLFAFILRSNRYACIRQIRQMGVEGHAKIMADRKQLTIQR